MSVSFVFLILLFLLLFAAIFWSVFKHTIKLAWGLIINTVFGLVGIFLLNLLGFTIQINTITILIVAIFGLLGVVALAFLTLFGVM